MPGAIETLLSPSSVRSGPQVSVLVADWHALEPLPDTEHDVVVDEARHAEPDPEQDVDDDPKLADAEEVMVLEVLTVIEPEEETEPEVVIGAEEAPVIEVDETDESLVDVGPAATDVESGFVAVEEGGGGALDDGGSGDALEGGGGGALVVGGGGGSLVAGGAGSEVSGGSLPPFDEILPRLGSATGMAREEASSAAIANLDAFEATMFTKFKY